MWTYRLRRLVRVRAAPGWLAVLWGIIEKASVIDWLRDVWASLPPGIVVVSDYALIIGGLGLLWLVGIVVSKPRSIDLQEFVRARGKGVLLENETITDRVIEGPATVYPDLGTTVRDSVFENVSFAVLSDDQQVVVGAIVLRNCIIARCRFRGIGFVGKAEAIAIVRGGIKMIDVPPGHPLRRDGD